MAVITTMAMPPLLRWGLSPVPMSAGERERLEREEIEARGFVPNLERLLLAVDDSPNGRLASRLAGLLAAALISDDLARWSVHVAAAAGIKRQ